VFKNQIEAGELSIDDVDRLDPKLAAGVKAREKRQEDSRNITL
jgi:hypothetical protein